MKVFILFLMDNLGYPLEHETIIKIVEENTNEITLDYDECLRQLSESGHLLYDEVVLVDKLFQILMRSKTKPWLQTNSDIQ